MHHLFEKTISIVASPAKVWSVFTDPGVTRQMGGEYVSDWKIGSSFGFKGIDGTVYTHGSIIDIEPEKLLKHYLYTSEDRSVIISTVTYEFHEDGATTKLHAIEEFTIPIDDNPYADVVAGWDAALTQVKELAEK
jgi:uncharacterized protein YndB with AHSA1/START domain